MPAPPARDGVNTSLLDPGTYPTKPRPPLGTAGGTWVGGQIESRRMGNNVVGPWEVDPVLTSLTRAGVPRPTDLDLVFGAGVGATAVAHQLIAVFQSGRASATSSQKVLVNVVLRFPSPEEAAAAAAEMASTSGRPKSSSHGDEPTSYEPVTIPGYPATAAKSYRQDLLGAPWRVLAFTAHGMYVLGQSVEARDSAAGAALAATTLDKQGPLIDQFQATPTDQLAQLPIDPDGLLARTLRPDSGVGELYQPHAQLHFDDDPPRTQTLFDTAHLQLVAKGNTIVYQTPDGASAQKIVDIFAAAMADNQNRIGPRYAPAQGIPGLSTAKCLENKSDAGSSFYCVAVADRYAIEVSTHQELVAHQKVSAQYLMLTST
ncbi:DUF7373 family lipoprotein [Mycobacterium talmoniae]